jgi:hypothetical protein
LHCHMNCLVLGIVTGAVPCLKTLVFSGEQSRLGRKLLSIAGTARFSSTTFFARSNAV